MRVVWLDYECRIYADRVFEIRRTLEWRIFGRRGYLPLTRWRAQP